MSSLGPPEPGTPWPHITLLLQDQVSKDKALQSMASMSSAQIVSASVLQNKFSPPSPLPQAVFSTSSRVQGPDCSHGGGGGEVGGHCGGGVPAGFLHTDGPGLSHPCSSGAAPLSWDSSLDPLRSKYGAHSSSLFSQVLASAEPG